MNFVLALIAASPWNVYNARGWPLDPGLRIESASGIASLRQNHGLTEAALVDEQRFDQFLAQGNFTAVQDPQLRPVIVARGNPDTLARFGRVEYLFNGFYRIYLKPGRLDPANAARAVAAVADFAEPDQWLQMQPRTFNDAMYAGLWHLHASSVPGVSPDAHIHADDAWNITTGNQRIAILDDGFLVTHEDLAPNLPSPGSPDLGYDFVDNDSDPSPHPGDTHGTHVMGVALARGNNGLGVSGVCPNCQGIAERVFAEQNFDNDILLGATSDAAAAFDFAAVHGARVINCSWGPIIDASNPVYQPMPAIIDQEVQKLVTQGSPPGSKGVLFSWAAGNNGTATARALVSFDGWAGDPRVFAVGASTPTATRANYSAVGPAIRLLAPSSNDDESIRLPTTDAASSSSYSTLGGTSGAAPVAAGVAALVLSAYPELSLAQLMEVLTDSADKIDSNAAAYDASGKSCTDGAGRINANSALLLAGSRQSAYASGYTLHLELCGDGIDNDGDGTIDNPATCKRCIPTGNGDPIDGVDNDCDGYVDNPAICVDPSAVAANCPNGPEPEVCDGIDNDCNGIIDDFTTDNLQWQEETRACGAGKKGVCGFDLAVCVDATWLCQPPTSYQSVETLCDGLDNDCDGTVDEGCPPAKKKGCDALGAPSLIAVGLAEIARRISRRKSAGEKRHRT